MSLADLESLDMRESHNLWHLYSNGLVGPFKDYLLAYKQMMYMNGINETLIAVNSKRHKPAPMIPFEEMFPEATKWFQLGQENAPKPEDMSMKIATHMVSMESGAPAWLIDAVKQNQEDSKCQYR